MTWSETTLGACTRVEHGFAFKGEHFSESGRYVVLTPGNFHEQGGFRPRPGKDRFYAATFPERYLLDEGALLVAMTEQGEGLLGSAALIPEGGVYLHNQRLGLVKERPDAADRRFLYYLFNTDSVREQVRNTSSGAKVRHTSPERIYAAKVRIPTVPVQRKIAAILSVYDDLIANNQRRIALLEAMAEEIYREWFVRMRFPGRADSASEGLLPMGWSRQPLGGLARLIKRGISPNYDDDTEHVVLNQKCIRDGRVSLSEARRHQTQVPDEKLLRYGDVLVNSTGVGTLGRVAVFDIEKIGITCDSHVTILRPNARSVQPEYLAHTVSLLQAYFESMAAGSTGQTELSRELIARTKIVVPSANVQDEFAAHSLPMRQQRRALLLANEALAQARDALLPRLISGKLKVDHLDIRMPPRMRAVAPA